MKETKALVENLSKLLNNFDLILNNNFPNPQNLLLEFQLLILKFEACCDFNRFNSDLCFPHLPTAQDPEYYPRVLLRSKLVPQVQESVDLLWNNEDESEDEMTVEEYNLMHQELVSNVMELKPVIFKPPVNTINTHMDELHDILKFMNGRY